jgi:hypothetical protein
LDFPWLGKCCVLSLLDLYIYFGFPLARLKWRILPKSVRLPLHLANEVDAVSDCSMGRLDDDDINSCHEEALFQDTFDELAERDMDDRCDAITKSMWEDYQRRLAARVSDEDEDNSSDGNGDGDETK